MARHALGAEPTGGRATAARTIALLLAVLGVVLVIVGACSSRNGPPQPSGAALGAGAARTDPAAARTDPAAARTDPAAPTSSTPAAPTTTAAPTATATGGTTSTERNSAGDSTAKA